MQTNQHSGPLAGIKILDLSTVVMGPFATQLLGDMGADIIKIEPPSGDNMRAVGPMRSDNMGALFLHLNRNKRSIVLDLKTEDGRQACLDLIQDADVLLYNLRPESMARLHLSYDDVAAINPRILYVGAYGFSENGPNAGRPAYDDLIQGMVGIPDLYQLNSGSEPRYAPLTIADRIVGMQTALAILGGLLETQKSRQGQQVEVSMYETMARFVLGDHLGGETFTPPLGGPGYQRLIAYHRKPYRTSDGYLIALIYNDKHWQRFFEISGVPGLTTDPRFSTHEARAENIAELYQLTAKILAENTTEHWLKLLGERDIPVSPMQTISELIKSELDTSANIVQSLEHPSEGSIRTVGPSTHYSRTPTAIKRHAPTLGEHTAEVLHELGYSNEKISAMLAVAHPVIKG